MRLTVRVTPNASRDTVEGVGLDANGRPYLKVRVCAVPEDGKANKAVEKLLAKTLGLPKSAVKLVTGHTARLKILDVDCGEDSPAAHTISEWTQNES